MFEQEYAPTEAEQFLIQTAGSLAAEHGYDDGEAEAGVGGGGQGREPRGGCAHEVHGLGAFDEAGAGAVLGGECSRV